MSSGEMLFFGILFLGLGAECAVSVRRAGIEGRDSFDGIVTMAVLVGCGVVAIALWGAMW